MVAYQASLSMGFPKQEEWSGVPLPSPGNLPNSGIEPMSSAWQANSLPMSHQGNSVYSNIQGDQTPLVELPFQYKMHPQTFFIEYI